MRKAFIILADGFEEIEALTVVDVLRRGGIQVTTVGLVSTVVEGSHYVKIITDKRLSEVDPDNFEMVILPGGPGYKKLSNSKVVLDILKRFDKKKKFIAAICAAPVVLARAGIINEKIVTVYPGLEKEVPRPRDASVIVDGNVITSRAPGASILFSLKLVEILTNKKIAEKIKKDLVVK